MDQYSGGAYKRRNERDRRGPFGGPRDAYRTYLRSDAWREKAKAAKERAGGRCSLCVGSERLEVHHRTYARVGAEREEDLTVLCATCHRTFHSRLTLAEKRPTRGGSSLREAA